MGQAAEHEVAGLPRFERAASALSDVCLSELLSSFPPPLVRALKITTKITASGSQRSRAAVTQTSVPVEQEQNVRLELRQNQHRLDPADITKLAAQYEAGASLAELARSFGVYKRTVSDHLVRSGIQPRPATERPFARAVARRHPAISGRRHPEAARSAVRSPPYHHPQLPPAGWCHAATGLSDESSEGGVAGCSRTRSFSASDSKALLNWRTSILASRSGVDEPREQIST